LKESILDTMTALSLKRSVLYSNTYNVKKPKKVCDFKEKLMSLTCFVLDAA